MSKKSTSSSHSEENKGLVPLNARLYTEFSIETLEERLETDPIALAGLFDEIMPLCVTCKKSDFDCANYSYCECDGVYCTCYNEGYTDPCNCNSVDTDIECFK